MCNKNASNIEKQRYEGSSIKDVSKSGGGSDVSRGGGAKFQLLLGYRRSHKGKFMFPKKVAKNICEVEAKKISAPGIK